MAEKTIYELSSPGRLGVKFPDPDVPLSPFPQDLLRVDLPLPELSELDVVRHFTNLSKLNYSIDGGFYPLGSCTMKYNPKVNEDDCSFTRFCIFTPHATRRNPARRNLAMMFTCRNGWPRLVGLPPSACNLLPALRVNLLA